MKFAIICTLCLKHPESTRIDNTIIHFLGQDLIAIECCECGATEYLGEEIRIAWPKKDDLIKEKKKIEKELKKRHN